MFQKLKLEKIFGRNAKCDRDWIKRNNWKRMKKKNWRKVEKKIHVDIFKQKHINHKDSDDSYLIHSIRLISFQTPPLRSCYSAYQNLHWKLGQQTPSVGTLLAYLETKA